jgi:hypothetical protein
MTSKPTKRQIRIVEHFVKKVVLRENTLHEQDWLFKGFTFDDLITALQSNERDINENSVKKVFKELYNESMENALYELKTNMNQIIKLASR